MKKLVNYFSKFELLLWGFSVALVLVSYIVFGAESYVSIVASLIGVTALILNAKGNPLGPALLIAFSMLYGIISYSFRYYGEMITYLGMSMPMSVIALVSWLRNPHKGRRSEVSVGKIKKLDRILIWVYSAIVTVAFYFILGYLGTKSLILSTVSVATSFIAAYLTFRRSAYFAFAYAINDVILILLWILASTESAGYVSVVVCFLTFLMNDLYTFFSWKKRKKRQISDQKETAIICN